MSVHTESKHEAYDAVIIGSGVGGITAATMLAKAGKKVLVVERHDRPGGYAHSFQRGKYRWDAAVHVISGCEPLAFGEGAFIDDLLRLLGVRDLCTFLPVSPFYGAIYPGFRIDAPTGVGEFIDAHARHWPQERAGLRQLVRLQSRLNRESLRLPSDISSHDALRLPEEFPFHHQYGNATLGQVMDQFLTDPRLKAVFSTMWTFLGLPPSRVSFIKFSALLLSHMHTGVYYCQGTFQNLANALVEALKRNGGELLLRTRVRRVLVGDGKVTGVILENGQRIQAPIVVSNADARQTFDELVGSEHLPQEFVEHLRALKPSLSAVVAYVATSLDLRQMGAAHEMFLFRSWDHDESFRSMVEGRPDHVVISIPSLADPSLAPQGEHVLSILTLLPYDLAASWREQKDRRVETLLDRVEDVFPGFRDHITFCEGASPRTMERYTLNLMGAIYGWEATPEQTGANRLTRTTPLQGLYLAGHWTQPGAGITSVAVSGVQTAQVILGYPTLPELLNAMRTGHAPA